MTARYLLDTNVFLWMTSAPHRLGTSIREVLETTPAESIYFSAVSSWEIAIKYKLGKLNLPSAPTEYVSSRILTAGFSVLPIQLLHTLAVADLPDVHRDPFDRLLAAQAKQERLTLLSGDKTFSHYGLNLIGTD